MNHPRDSLGPLEFGFLPSGGGAAEDMAVLLAAPAFLALADALPDGLVILDPDGGVCLINTAAEGITRLRRADVVGQPAEGFYRRAALEFEAQGSTPPRSGLVRSVEDGRQYLATVRLLPVRGGGEYALLLLRDLDLLDRVQRGARGGAPARPASRQALPPLGESTGEMTLSPRLRDLGALGVKALRRGARILILGESGCGKTALTRHIHASAGFDGKPFVHVNCGSIPESLFESEVFGYERGAFTGALQAGKRGFIEAAAGGTLFLDEVGEIPLISQAKLLKFLEDGTIQPVGSPHSRQVDARVIAATNRDLKAMVEAGQFRRDLYYRLAVITLEVPPLREQPDLIGPLLDSHLTRINAEREPPLQLSAACRRVLETHAYPGNVREMTNIMEHLAIVADAVAGTADLPRDVMGCKAPAAPALPAPPEGGETMPLREQVRAFEEAVIARTVEALGSKRKAAQALGVDIGTIVRKTKRGET